MDIMLQKHQAKHICDIPDGLRELCADISREVIRSQPDDICCFIADYLDTLLITRENAKIALKIVQNITLKSEQIVEILSSSGLKLKEIAAVAPRLQKAFRAYLEAVDVQKKECGCDASSEDLYRLDDESEISICRILNETGTTYREAQRAAIKIQALFRGHYKRMMLAEKRGEVQWQRAVANTMEILRKCGITQREAAHAATIIQAAYRGYYTRKNLKLRDARVTYEVIDMKAWLDMMFENSGLTLERANEASVIIQNAYRKYRARKYPGDAISSPSKTLTERGKVGLVAGGLSAKASARIIKDEILSPTVSSDFTESDDSESEFEVKSQGKFEASSMVSGEETLVDNVEQDAEQEELKEKDDDNKVQKSESAGIIKEESVEEGGDTTKVEGQEETKADVEGENNEVEEDQAKVKEEGENEAEVKVKEENEAEAKSEGENEAEAKTEGENEAEGENE